MIVSLIAAVSYNGIIGNNGTIPWKCKEDMKFFKEKTMGHPVIMGRKTYDSFPEQYKPLPGRFNVVISRNPKLIGLTNPGPDGPVVVGNLIDAIDFVDNGLADEEIFIIGGEQIYKEALDTDLVDRMYLNVLHVKVEGDTKFPYYDATKYISIKSTVEYKDFNAYTLNKKPEIE